MKFRFYVQEKCEKTQKHHFATVKQKQTVKKLF